MGSMEGSAIIAPKTDCSASMLWGSSRAEVMKLLSSIIYSVQPSTTSTSERIEGEMAFDMKQIAADMGVFFKDAVAS